VIARRRFLAALGATVLPARARAQAQPRRIGYLSNRAEPSAFDRAFVRRLGELGYVDGRNVAIDFRFNAGDFGRLRLMIDELVATRPDVIVASGPVVRVVARATSTIPIVMAAIADPVGQGVVTSLGRPGGNVTGMTLQSTELAHKRIQLLRELVPGLRRLGLFAVRGEAAVDPMRRDASVALAAEAGAAARGAGIALVEAYAREAREIPDALARFRRERAQALIVQVAPLTFDARQAIFAFARAERLPSLYEVRAFADEGGLLSYGPDLEEVYRRAAGYVDKILRGAKPAELPIEQPGKFELVVNLREAEAIGLKVPDAFLLRADDVLR
jgi:putative ABC transport system substrate-binding protein